MKKLLLLTLLFISGSVFAGSCDHSWQTAKDGSSCGDRAADKREGGRWKQLHLQCFYLHHLTHLQTFQTQQFATIQIAILATMIVMILTKATFKKSTPIGVL